MKKIEKILVANRGIIAKRIIRTCKKLGIYSIAIYAKEDLSINHIYEADEAYQVSDYTDQDEIIKIAIDTDSAIHPAYGFLSERADFSKLCEINNITFIAPSYEVLKISEDKFSCIELMRSNNILVCDSIKISAEDINYNHSFFEDKKFPFIVKPCKGGGGKGIFKPQNIDELDKFILENKELSKKLWGDDTFIVEQLLDKPKHIEVQILADKHGNIMHLFERECSMQRRNQKVIEESLSPSLNEKQREELYSISEKIAHILKIDNISTIEFLFHDNKFYFIEVNPRIQVEHGITEEITGIDLVEIQIKVANGENISYLKDKQKTIGHSIQCRIYSEDSFNFLPSTGKISYLALPEGDSLRIESGVVQGETISELYDPMLMKIITTGVNRDKAIKNMISALKNLYITGELNTNQMLLIEAMESKEFKDATYNTQTLYGIKPNLDNKIDIEITEELFKLFSKKETKILVNKNNNSDYWRPSFWDKR